MAKKTGSITPATHRLTLEIAEPQAVVWKAFNGRHPIAVAEKIFTPPTHRNG